MKEKNLAAIDLGTNSFHLIIVKVKEDGSYESLGKEKESVRLGSGAGTQEIITPDAIERGINCLKRFKALAEVHNAEIRAVATSALREAKNRDSFLELARNELGIHIEIISGFEEARLIYFGILQGLPVYDKKILMIDIGGGSTEFLVGLKGEIEFAQSLKIGAVRLTDKFFMGDPISLSDIKQCKIYVQGTIGPMKREILKLQPEIIIGSSGTVQSIASMVIADVKENPNRSLNNYTILKDNFKKIRNSIDSAETLKKRTKLPGLDSKRADIIVAGSIILEEIFDMFSIQKLQVSDYALREGIIYDTIVKWREHQDNQIHPLANIRLKAIKSLFNTFPYEKEHVEKVTEIALKIYDSLAKHYNFTGDEREYLEAAAILHEIGFGISHSSHHKHSYYIIRNSELMVGFHFEEIEIIALVARYHRKSPPKSKHTEFISLTHENQKLVKKLASILRIADGLDRSHQSMVEDLELEITKDEVKILLKIKENMDPHVDIWSADQKKELFEEYFDKKVSFQPKS
ncbi:MAG: Ppx/GppA family phosphatase [Leptospiraceae bacterium]|nr:Ppx/GppA family phosphatase [Leptospiraceae bacterium]